MTILQWDVVGERRYETGVDRGVLYIPTNGVYDEGVAWNGLTAVTESPSGAEASAQYADNIKYLNLVAAEEFGGTIEAFTYPSLFEQCDGSATPEVGVSVGQQTRKTFGLAYRTNVGTDTDADAGYKIHLVYGALAAPSEKAYATVNESPEALTFSWAITTTPVAVTGLKPAATLTIDSTQVDAGNLSALEDALYGTSGTDARLPLPDEVIAMFPGTALTSATTTAPTFNAGTGVITIPTVTGVVYRRGDTNAIVTGTVTIATSGASLTIKAAPANGYRLSAGSDDDWVFTRS